MTDPAAIDALKAEALRTNVADWAARNRWLLRPSGSEMVGPCPLCGGTGKRNADRFSISRARNLWNCRKCGVGGHDVISLVRHVDGVGFVAALERITGHSAAEPVDPARQKAAQAEQADRAARNTKIAARQREKARHDGYAIWRAGQPAIGTPVEHYLGMRGLNPAAWPQAVRAAVLAKALRYHPDLAYSVHLKSGKWVHAHRGPAMLAAIVLPDGRFGAVHRTWLDPDCPRGKAVIRHPGSGDLLQAKTMRGTKRGGAIRLFTPKGATGLVMGEGIETTLTPLATAAAAHTAYWAGADLGNMAGRARYGADGKRMPAEPDMADAGAFVPPDWCADLTLLGDGDSDKKTTRNKLMCCARRAMLSANRAGCPCQVRISWPGAGMDFNDLVCPEVGRHGK
jgi:hypothetical protein